MLRRFLVILLLCLAVAGMGPASASRTPDFAPPHESRRTVYRGFTLIDGRHGPGRPAMAIITKGATIEAVVPEAQLTPQQLAGANQIELSGRFVIPGLIDSHQHLATPPDRRAAEAQMRRDLYSGITAARIMADDLRSIAELARASLAGEIAGTDLYYAALVAGPSFFEDPRTRAISAGWTPGETPWAQAIDDRTDLRLAIARARGTGATGLKIYANLEPRLVSRLTREAHRQGLPVWVHGMVFPTPPAQVIAAGPDVVSHICYLAYQLSNPRPQSYQQRFPVNYAVFEGGDNAVMEGLFAQMRRRGIILDATLRVYAESDRRAAAPGARPYHCNLDLAARLTDQARRAGVAIAAGTDGFTPRENPWPALFEELELLVERAGMTPAEAIRSATAVAAQTIGQEERMGTIEAGKIANLVVLDADPMTNIANLRSVIFSVKRGRRFDRSDFRPIGPEEIPDDER
jgi:cytosine/adenosine deaminase-related metal-dependent hydrolase